MSKKSNPKIAMSDDFLKTFSNLPGKIRNKVLAFLNKFKSNPTSSGINFEKINNAKDSSIRSVRIDKAYRGIIKKPTSGDIFLLLWVDHHDAAYQWAQKKKCHINPETGAIQIYSVEEGQGGAKEKKSPAKNRGLFKDTKDKHLLKLGVPEALLSLVRSIETEEELTKAEEHLPVEASEALTLLAAGSSLQEVYHELNIFPEAKRDIDTEDYVAALENPDTLRRFFVVEDDFALQEILEAPLEKWRVFLHPSQRALVERDWNGPVRVLGGAGTGKTVVALHRAKWLAENVFTGENDRILFTTFTRNLAADIEENLGKICPDELMGRIEVVNLDRWVHRFLKKNGYTYDVDYGKRTKPFWEKAAVLAPSELGLDDDFLREEWNRVIQTQGITTLSEYLKASRLGRGVRLSRKKRKEIWPVFEEYRILLNENNLREVDDAMRDACALLKEKGKILPYCAVIVDEAQDMGPQAFKLIRQIAGDEKKNDLFIVGDAHQRIYRHKVTLGHCGIKIRGRGKKLRINYRTTEENRRWAVNLLKGIKFDDLDGGEDTQKGYKSLMHGIKPRLEFCESFSEEVAMINDYLNQIEKNGEPLSGVCLVARTHDLFEQYEGALKGLGKQTCSIYRDKAEDRKQPGVRLATMHRVKGLEFDRVIIASVNDGIVPLDIAAIQSDDPVIQRDRENYERALLYVAVTRAKKEVLVTSFGKASRFISTAFPPPLWQSKSKSNRPLPS